MFLLNFLPQRLGSLAALATSIPFFLSPRPRSRLGVSAFSEMACQIYVTLPFF
jgi:hypothetical protein